MQIGNRKSRKEVWVVARIIQSIDQSISPLFEHFPSPVSRSPPYAAVPTPDPRSIIGCSFLTLTPIPGIPPEKRMIFNLLLLEVA